MLLIKSQILVLQQQRQASRPGTEVGVLSWWKWGGVGGAGNGQDEEPGKSGRSRRDSKGVRAGWGECSGSRAILPKPVLTPNCAGRRGL